MGLVKVNINGQETFIGEGEMFKERNRFDGVIVTYLSELKQPDEIEKAILIQVQKRLKNVTQLQCKGLEWVQAEKALGDQFEGFNLVNVPCENSAIEAVLKASNKSQNQKETIEIDSYLFNPPECRYMDVKDSIIHQYYLKTKMFSNEISYVASSIDLPVILIESDDKNPQNFTFKKFDTNGQETTPKSFEEIKEKNPNAVFIYYNGVNHFQALVPQQPAQ